MTNNENGHMRGKTEQERTLETQRRKQEQKARKMKPGTCPRQEIHSSCLLSLNSVLFYFCLSLCPIFSFLISSLCAGFVSTVPVTNLPISISLTGIKPENICNHQNAMGLMHIGRGQIVSFTCCFNY